MNRNRRSGLTHSIVALVLILAAGISHAQSPAPVTRVTFAGTVGQSRIGMVLLINAAGTVTGGHYFYAKYLKDIPLQAGTQGSGLILYEPEGGQFALRFKGNGGEAGKPLDFHNSIGMEGRWLKGDRSYPVALQLQGDSKGPANARWYEEVTSESDAVFEARVQSFYKAVIAGDRTTAVRHVDFPLRVNQNGESRTIHSAAELSAQWSQIFTPSCIDAIKKTIPHDMFVRNGQAMLGNGLVWFGSKGVDSINIP